MSLTMGSVTEVCYVTGDMEKAAAHWANIADSGPFFLMPSQEMTFDNGSETFTGHIKAALGFAGTTLVEFIEPLPDSPAIFAEVLEANGEGAIHHIMTNIAPLAPGGFEALCHHYRSAGLECVLEFEVPALGRVCFFDARREMGVFIEVMDAPPSTVDLLEAMYGAHQRRQSQQRKGQQPLQNITDLMA